MRTLLLSLCLLPAWIQGQTVLSATSGSGSIGGTQIDWTCGEMTAVTTAQNASLIVTQGFHQPADQTISTQEPQLPYGSVKVYPNPASTWLNIESAMSESVTLNYTIYDQKGRLVLNPAEAILQEGAYQTLDISILAAGVYYLQIQVSGKGQSVFTIEKID